MMRVNITWKIQAWWLEPVYYRARIASSQLKRIGIHVTNMLTSSQVSIVNGSVSNYIALFSMQSSNMASFGFIGLQVLIFL